MSSGAIGASDPGGGETKPVAGGDVTTSEAAGEVPAFAADVKVEGKATLATDVDREGGDTAVSDPLYANESAGMVGAEGHGDEPAEGLEAVNGEEEMLEAGARDLLTETEKNPVLVVHVPAAAAGGGSAIPEHAEAESNKVEDHVNVEPGTKNNESDNGIAHFDKEIQNNVPDDIEESSKEHEGDGAPVVDQTNNASEMLPQTGEQFPDVENSTDSNLEAASLGSVDQGARYCLPPHDKGGFQVADLVWGKVKSHPWWPGEIFDPSDASELALKHQKKGSHLVAYFGDNTFAWCDESQLKPFVTNYSQMEKQSSSDAFVGSVNNALEELSRRILSGMSCSCLPEELADNGMSYTVDNAGLKDGVTCSAVNRPEILNCFSPENLLHYIKELALFPGQGGDLLELVIACSQLTSFYRSKGCPELASFQTGDAWVEDGLDCTDTLSTQNVMVEEPVINEVHPTQDKPKRGRGRPRKQKPGGDQVVMEKRSISNQVNDTSYNEKQVGMDFDNYGNLQNKNKRNFESFEDSEKSSAPTGGSSFKIGECIRRAASQLTGSPSIMKAQNAAEGENGEFDIFSDDAGDELTVEKRAKRRSLHRNHTADPKELLSQLCLVATEPMNGYNFSVMIISYFSDYRNYIVSTTTEANIVDKGTSRRGRKRKEVLPSPDVETTDHMQDSYWSGLSLHNHPIHDLRKESPTTRPRRRRRSSSHAYVPLSELGEPVPKKQIQVMERSIIHVDEKMIDELKPTALVLSFARSASIPSELDLVKMFSRFGPLKEREAEVHRETNTVKVVFKKRADAERAFSAAGKYGTFGPSLRSYRLVSMPFSLETQSANNPVKHPENHGMEIPGSNQSEAPKDSMEVDLVQKTDEVEVAGEPSSEEVETVRQISQVQAADSTFVSQDRFDEAGNIDAELIDHVNQIGKAAQAASVSEESRDVEQVYTQKEVSANDLPTETEILNSDAITKELPQNAPDNVETDIVEDPKQSHNSRDNAVFEAVIEAPSTAQDHTEEDTGNAVPEEPMVSPELQSQTPGDLPTETETLHSDAILKKLPQNAPDNMQTDIAEDPKQSHNSGDNAVFEAVTEAPSTAQDHTEDDTGNEVPEEHMVSLELQSQTPGDLPTETETLHSDAIVKELPHNAPDNMQTDIAEDPKQSHNPGGNAVFDAVTEARSTTQDHTEDDTGNEVPEEDMVSLELQSQTPGDLPTETETLYSDAIVKELPHNAPDNLQTDIARDPKQSHNLGDNAVFEAVTEAPSTAQDHTEDDTGNEVPEEHMVSPELQSQTPGDLPTETETLHSDAMIKELPQNAPNSMQTDIAEDPKQSHNPGDNAVFEAVTEAPSTAQDHTEDDTGNKVPEEHMVSLELQSQTPGDPPTETETLHSDAIVKELPHNAPDNMQTDIAEDPKQSHNPGDAVFEAVTEAPSTAQDHTEDDTGNEVPEEHMVSPELQSQTPGEKLVGQSATEQMVGSEDPKPQAENFVAEPVVLGAVGQVEIELESKTTVEVSGEQGYSIEQTVQVEALIEASGGQLEVGRQIPEDESIACATTEHSMVVDETVEAKVVLLDESIENNAAVIGVVEETAEGETKEEASDEKGKIENNEDADKLAPAGKGKIENNEIIIDAPDEKTENKADADTPAGETKEGEITVEETDEKIESKVTAEPVIGETTEGQTAAGEPVEEARTAEDMVEDVKVLDDKSTAAEKPVENATVVAHENSTTVENTLKDAIVAPPDANTTNAEKTAIGATIETQNEDAPAERTIEDTSVEAPDVQAGASE
uniref:PWWP domain-containing protein n=1 Tax=Zea mays TaxID=4577 RepID=A0A804UGL3_MAIZE